MSTAHRHEFLLPLAEAVRRAGGRLCLVGGVVRDMLLGPECAEPSGQEQNQGKAVTPDFDLVVFGLELDRIGEIASQFGPGKFITRRTMLDKEKQKALVHLQLGGALLEISPARRFLPGWEAKADGLSDLIEFSAQATVLDDALGRDLTLNAIFFDPLSGEFEDPLGGMDHLRRHQLSLCHPCGFILDPLRMMRVFGLISRYAFKPDSGLLAACAGGPALLTQVPHERLWPEWYKWALGRWPQSGLDYLAQSGLRACWPELEAMAGTPQNVRFHPEGNVWQHTVLVLEALSKLALPPQCNRVVLSFAALLHDAGKPLTTKIWNGRLISHGHAHAGLAPARNFLDLSIRAPHDLLWPVLKLVERHMDLGFQNVSAKALRRLARKLAPESHLAEFWALAASDANGRGPAMPLFAYSLEDFSAPLHGDISAPPLVQGRDLLEHFPGRLHPGPELGLLLRRVDVARDNEEVETREQALEWVRNILDSTSSVT